ncbi:MAG TPA: hypothetical protein VFK52_00525 [Nocardioidaceae bacterium]|nr:hypothetical protein [Nocardioidaceae bacterium]
MSFPAALRRMLPAIVIVVALALGSVLAEDPLGLYIACAIAVVTAANIALAVSDEPLRMKAARPSARPPWEEPLLTAINWVLIVVGVVAGTAVAWISAGNVFAALAGVVIGAVLGLVLGAVVSGLIGLVLSLLSRPEPPGS